MPRLTQIVKRPYHRYYVTVSEETAALLKDIWETRGNRDSTMQEFLASIVADWAQKNRVGEGEGKAGPA